jgi:flagellar hook-length control protein FliK
MSPERTNNVTSLPVRPDRSQRSDQQQAPASDFFATLLDAHADRKADRAPSRRERQPSDDGPRDRRPVDRPARADRPADVRDRSKPSPAADQPTSEPAPTDEPTPADTAAAAAAASAMLGLLAAAVAPPQQQQPTTPVTGQAAPAVEEPVTAPQPVAQVPAVVPQPAAVTEPAAPQGAPSGAVEEAAHVPGPETAGIEGNKIETPAEPAVAAVATEEVAQAPVAGRASVADSGNTRPGDRRSEGVSGGGAEARPSAASADTPVTEQPTAQSGQQGASDQRQTDRQDAPRVTAQAAQPTPQAPTQRVDVTPLAPAQGAVVNAGEPKGAATLAQAPRAVGQLIHLASERGVQHARLNLRPVELGGIEIRLVASSAGVTAHVVADSPEAARLLQQAGDDLRRSLADNNVELLSLDVSTSDQERRDASAASGGFEQFDETGPRGRDGLGRAQRAGESDTDLPISTDQGTVLELPDGVLVDVLA